jgi:uncharacterized protein with NRDE domain
MTPEEMAIKIYAESSRLDEGQVRFLMNLRDEDTPLPWEKIQAHHVRLFIELISRAIEVERNRCIKLMNEVADQSRTAAKDNPNPGQMLIFCSIASAMETMSEAIANGREDENDA